MNLPDRIETLINGILDGESSEEDIAELQSLIGDDAALASALADRIAEHRLLGLLYQPFDADLCTDAVMQAISHLEVTEVDEIYGSVLRASGVDADAIQSEINAKGRWMQGIIVLAAAVACLLAIGVWLVLFRDSKTREAVIANRVDDGMKIPVATLLLQEGCVWSKSNHLSEGDLAEGARLHRGRVDLESGAAVLRFDGGAELVMVGPAAIELKSAVKVLVHLGDVVIRADDGAEGFVVTTPTSEVVDLGTEFAVKVNPDGETEVHVLDGEVSYRKIDAASALAKLLRAGEGVAIDEEGAARAIPMNSPRFQEFVRQINPQSRADLLYAYEGFNYSPGLLPLELSSVGIGWNGPWRKRAHDERRVPSEDLSPGELEIVHGQMNVAWPVPGGRLGMLKLPPGGVFYVRPLQQPIDLGTDDVTYFSLMVREIARRNNRKPPHERLRLTFRSSEDYFGDALSFGHGQGFRPRIQAGDGKLFASPLVFPAEQTTLWIGKVVSRASGEDEISFRIYGEDETLDYAEPATWHVVTRGLNSDAKLDRVLISSTSQFGRIVDELRIGPSWRSVAPMLETRE